MSFDYSVYGLMVRSNLRLPELSPSNFTQPDVVVGFKSLPRHLKGGRRIQPWAELVDDKCMLRVSRKCRILVEGGRKIYIDLGDESRQSYRDETDVSDAHVRLIILGTAMGVIVLQRGMVPLHISSVRCPDGINGFTGPSGAGKSTLAAFLHADYKCGMFSDDVATFDPCCTKPTLQPGPRRLKLWSDALAKLEIEHLGSVHDIENRSKFQLTLHDLGKVQSSTLNSIIILDRVRPGESAQLSRLKGVEAFRALMSAVYRLELAEEIHGTHRLMNIISQLSQKIDIYRFRRRWDLKYIRHDINLLLPLFGLTDDGNTGAAESIFKAPLKEN